MSSISSLTHKKNACKFSFNTNSFYSKVISESNLSSLVPSNLSHSFSENFCSVGLVTIPTRNQVNYLMMYFFVCLLNADNKIFIKGYLLVCGNSMQVKIHPYLGVSDAAILAYMQSEKDSSFLHHSNFISI